MKEVVEMKTRWSFILLAGLLPIFIIPVPWVTVVQAKVILVALAVIIVVIGWALARFLEGTVSVPQNLIFVLAALLPIAYTVSALALHRSASSLVGGNAEQDTIVVMVLLYALLALPVLIFSSAFRALTVLFRAFFVGAALLVIFQIIRLSFPEALSLGVLPGSASALMGSWHDFGIMLGLLVFLSLALFSTTIFEKWWKWLAGAVGIVSLLLLIVVNWSDVWYMLGGLALLAVLYQWSAARRMRAETREIVRHSALWCALALFALLSGFASSFIYAHMPERLQVVQVEVRPSWQGTLAVGERVFSGGTTLVFGSGPNTFGEVWGLYKPEGVNATNFWNVDFSTGVGLIPTALVTVGVMGLIAWGILSVLVLWSAIRFARAHPAMAWARESASPLHALLFTVLGATLYLVLFQILYAPGITISALAFLFLGLLVVLQNAERAASFTGSLSAEGWRGMVNIGAVVVVAGLIVYAALTGLRATVSDALINRSALVYNSSQDISGALGIVREALVVYPNNDRAERAAVELGLMQLRKMAASGDSSDSARLQLQTTLSQTIEHGLSAVSIDAKDYQNWLALAGLYQNLAGAGVQGAYESAHKAYENARAANPTNPLPLVQLAQLELTAGKKDAALDSLNKALALKPNLAPALFLRSQINAGDGSFADAEWDARGAAELVPQDPLGWYNLGVIYYADHSYENAAASLSRAVSLQNDYSNALFVLALSLEKMGRREEAHGALSRVSVLNPDNATVLQFIADLEAGKPLNENASTP